MERSQETGMVSKLPGLKGTCVVSYHACRGQRTEHQNTEGRGHHRTGDKQSHRDLAGRKGRQSSARFLQAIRGSQQYQENLGGPGGRNRHVTSHKNNHPGVAWRHSLQ